jgi:hypothetical protein
LQFLPFVDEELSRELKKIKSKSKGNEALEEHQYLYACLQLGLRIDDLKILSPIDVAKLMLCSITQNEQTNKRKASQEDWDRLARKGLI